MENKIYFLGKSKDFKLAEQLSLLIKDELKAELEVAVVEKGFAPDRKFDAVAYELNDSIDLSITDKAYTYSKGQSSADICGFNFMKREKSRSLDIFSSSFMGRVNIPVDSQFTEESVLFCVAGFIAAGLALPVVLKAINSKIS